MAIKVMKFIKENWHKIVFFAYASALPAISSAEVIVPAPCNQAQSGKITNPICAQTINGFIKSFLEGIIKIGIPILALAIIYSGFLFVFARGNPEKLTKAREALLYSLIGAAIILGSWAIAQLISSTVLSLG